MKMVLCSVFMTVMLVLLFCLFGVDMSGKQIPRSNYKKYFAEDIWEEGMHGR